MRCVLLQKDDQYARLGLWSWALTQAILVRHPSLIPPLPLPPQVLLPAKSFGNPCTYTIRPGDSLWGLSQVGLKCRAVVCVTCVKGAKGVGGPCGNSCHSSRRQQSSAYLPPHTHPLMLSGGNLLLDYHPPLGDCWRADSGGAPFHSHTHRTHHPSASAMQMFDRGYEALVELNPQVPDINALAPGDQIYLPCA